MSLLENVKTEIADIVAELECRKKICPLEFHNPLLLQKLFEDDKAKVKGIWGGNRSGKSEEAARYSIKKGLARPKQRIWLCSET